MKDGRQKVLFLIPDLRGGGAERVFVHLMNNLNRRYFEVFLAVFKKEGVYFNQLAQDVRVFNLACRTRTSLFKIVAVINQEKPDVVFSTIFSLNIIVGLSSVLFRHKKIRFILRETNCPSSRKLFNKHPFNSDWLYKISYGMCDTVVCQSDDMLEEVQATYKIPSSKLLRIHNPLDIKSMKERSSQGSLPFRVPQKTNLVAMGSLRPEKGYDLLLSALALTGNSRLHLHIIGDGHEKHFLHWFTDKLEIHDQVTFHGFQENAYYYLKLADAFVLSSRSEGFPNTLLEALALGCPAITFDCKGGIREIIQDGINGIIVPEADIGRLSEVMNDGRYLDFDQEIVAASVSKFSLSEIIPKYERLFLGQHNEQAALSKKPPSTVKESHNEKGCAYI